METKFTPGPWEIEGEGQEVVGILASGHNHFIAKLSGWAQPQQDRNARLIASAPDLFEACEYLEKVLLLIEKTNCLPVPSILRNNIEVLQQILSKVENR